MTPLLLALFAGPADAKPLDLSPYQAIEVSYTMTTKGTLSCATTFKGAGAKPVVDGNRITFEGTWTIVADSCNGNTVWAPEDGTAFHTIRLGKGSKDIDAWVVHDKAEHHERFESDISARGQYWINELAATPDGKGAIAYTSTETQGVFPLSITIEHDLKAVLSTEAPAPEAPAPEAPAPEASAPETPADAPAEP